MMTFALRRYAFSVSAACALLAGCGGSHPPIGVPGAVRLTPAFSVPADHGRSWMLPEATSVRVLVYASAGSDVSVYDYATGRQVGSLTGFNNPLGQCVDRRGDVFLTTSIDSAGAVLEYRHGASTPVKTFSTDGNPAGCSISPHGGDLAVVNAAFGVTSDVEIWKHASGTPVAYSNKNDCGSMWPPGYDNDGNLYIESGKYRSVCEVKAGGSSLIAVTFDHDIGFPGSVMWDGKYLAFTDQTYAYNTRKIHQGYTAALYQVRETRKGLSVVGTTVLRYKPCGTQIAQPFIVGTKNTPANDVEGTVVVGGNQACAEYTEYITPLTYWHYPQNGRPFKFVHPTPDGISGVSVSISQ